MDREDFERLRRNLEMTLSVYGECDVVALKMETVRDARDVAKEAIKVWDLGEELHEQRKVLIEERDTLKRTLESWFEIAQKHVAEMHRFTGALALESKKLTVVYSLLDDKGKSEFLRRVCELEAGSPLSLFSKPR